MNRYSSLIGNTYNRLTIIYVFKKYNKTYAHCLCNCGNEHDANLYNIIHNKIKSCGCLKKENTKIMGHNNKKHGHAITDNRNSTYRSWETMKSRCLNKTDISYSEYGGRGITVCERWKESYLNFLEDMGERPEKTTLDRINNNGNYEPSNCRWATLSEQSRNKRNNVMLTFNGETKLLIEFSTQYNIPYALLYDRIYRQNWDIEKAFLTPVDKTKRNKKCKNRY